MRRRPGTPEQLFFDGFGGPPGECDRLFFAIFPEPEVARATAMRGRNYGRQLGLRSRVFEPDRLHVSLFKVGDYDGLPRHIVDLMKSVALKVRASSFAVSFDQFGSFGEKGGGHRPQVLTSSHDLVGLTQLYLSLARVLLVHQVGEPTWFKPHMTVFYDDPWLPTRPIAPISWTVREFCLVHSLVNRHRYSVLGRWPLEERQGLAASGFSKLVP